MRRVPRLGRASGLTLVELILALGLLVMDMPAPSFWQRFRFIIAWPFIGLGRNSLLVYFGSHLLVMVMLQHGGKELWAAQLAPRVDVFGQPQVSFLLAMLVFWIATASLLHRLTIYLRP